MSDISSAELDAMKVDDLRAFADKVGVDYEDVATKTQIRATIKSVLGIAEDEADEPKASAPATKEKTVFVFISSQGKENGPVSVSLNGVRLDIQRDRWAEIKESFAKVLGDARGMVVDPNTKEVSIQSSYPFQMRESAPTKDFQTPKALSF